MRAYAAFLAFLLTLGVGLSAFAQNITVAGAQVDRDGPGHDISGLELFISRSDCESAERFTFPFAISNGSGVDAVEVWLADNSGTDCKSIEARNASSTGSHCVLLASTVAEAAGDIVIPSAAIANAISGVDECVDAAPGDAWHHVTLFFLLIRAPAEAVPNEDAATFETSVDLVGPAPPTDVVATNGDGSVELKFSASEAEDLRGYFVYCAPPDAAGGAAGCESSILQSGHPPPDPEFRCAPTQGDDPISATNALNVKDIVGGERIGMAIAAVDTLGNPGVLSNVLCGEPRPVEPEDNESDGSCSAAAQGPGARGSTALVALALAAAGGLVLRSRHKRRSAHSAR